MNKVNDNNYPPFYKGKRFKFTQTHFVIEGNIVDFYPSTNIIHLSSVIVDNNGDFFDDDHDLHSKKPLLDDHYINLANINWFNEVK